MPNLRPVVVVEDNPHDAELTLAALKRAKFANEIVMLRDGEEALDYVYQRGAFESRPPGPPAVIFLDMKMPRVDGLEVLRQIKSDATLKVIPIVMVTSSMEEADLARSYQFGANGYVVKPIGFEKFMEAIMQAGIFWAILNEPPALA